MSLSYMHYFGRCSTEQTELVLLPYSCRTSTCYSKSLHNFSATITKFYENVYVNSFYSHTGRLLNHLPVECFPLTYIVASPNHFFFFFFLGGKGRGGTEWNIFKFLAWGREGASEFLVCLGRTQVPRD